MTPDQMSTIDRRFVGGVWDGRVVRCIKDATAQLVNIPVLGTSYSLWSGYLLNGDRYEAVANGSEDECRDAIKAMRTKNNEGAD